MYGEFGAHQNNSAAHTMLILQENQCDFLTPTFNSQETIVIKKRIVECILSTDSLNMNKLRREFTQHLEQVGIEDEEDRGNLIDISSPQNEEMSKQLISNIILHCSVMSISLRDFKTSANWIDLQFEEFFG